MPGVVVTTQTVAGPTTPLRAPSGQFFVVGLTERGSTTQPILVRGLADVTTLTGARVSYGAVYDALKEFFDEGGQQAYISRVVGPAATVGTLTLQDRAGTPVNTLRVDAANAGSWSTQLQVQVANGALTNTFRIIVTLGGVVVEDKNNLDSPATAVLQFANSNYVRLTNLASGTAAPNNNPAVLAATSLSAGSDDRASVVSATYVSALDRFVPELGDGSVAIPGQVVNAIWVGINTHCKANNRIGLLAAAQTESKANLLTRVLEVDSEYCGLFTPWILVSDGAGGTRTISPESYVAAVRSRAHDQVGPWQAPAGQRSQAKAIVNLDQAWNATDSNDLDAGRVSVIRTIAGTFRLYGWRSMSSSSEYIYLHNRDLLNYLSVQGGKVLEKYVFEPIDGRGQLLSDINSALVGLVDPIAQKNGLYPLLSSDGRTQLDPGYKVETGNTVNTPTSLATNTVNARLSVRITPVGGLIALTIFKTGLLSSV